MSRIAKAPITIPSGVDIKIDGGVVSAKGPKGELSFDLSPGIELVENGGTLNVQLKETKKKASHFFS